MTEHNTTKSFKYKPK